MASGNDAPIVEGPVIVFPPIPSSCFSPVATITGISSLTTAVLPPKTECSPWANNGAAGFELSSAYSSRGVCPGGWMNDEAWNTDLGPLTRKICCPSGFTPAGDDVSTTYTSSGTTTIEVGSSVFSTEFTAVVRTSWPSETCYSTLSAPTVLQLEVSTGEPPGSVTIANQMLVSADFVRIRGVATDSSNSPSSGGSASPSPRGSSTSGVSRGSPSPTSGGSRSPPPGDSTDPSPGASSNAGLSTQSPGLPQAATIGMAVGITAVVMALLFGGFIIFSRRKRKQKRLQQATMQATPYSGYPELETRPVENESYMMLDSGTKYELAADHSWKAVEAEPRQPDAAFHPMRTYRN